MNKEEMLEKLGKNFREEDWWQSNAEEGFKRMAVKLLGRGWSADEAYSFLEDVYCITAGEFGS